LRESVIEGKSRLWEGVATGAGGTTRDALGDDIVKQEKALRNSIGTNGSLMRCSPMGLWFGPWIDDSKFINSSVSNMSSVTHTHPHSIHASLMYTKILCRILANMSWQELSPENPLEVRIISRLNDSFDYPYDPGAWPMRGTAEFSLYAGLYSFVKTNSFAEGIEFAVSIGGDTDTYAAIAGGLLGAYYCYAAILEEWKEAILGHNKMVTLATDLYQLRINQ